MELIIKCTEQTYSECKKISGLSETAFVIANGIPYNPKGDLISREQVLKELMAHQYSQDFCKEHGIEYSIHSSMVRIIVNRAPAVNSKPKGKWIPMSADCRGYSESFKCSICGAYIYPRCLEKELDYNYCPYCGADMEGENDNN